MVNSDKWKRDSAESGFTIFDATEFAAGRLNTEEAGVRNRTGFFVSTLSGHSEVFQRFLDSLPKNEHELYVQLREEEAHSSVNGSTPSAHSTEKRTETEPCVTIHDGTVQGSSGKSAEKIDAK